MDNYILGVWDDNYWPTGSSWHIFSETPSVGAINVQVMDNGGGYAYLSDSTNLALWTHIGLVRDAAAGTWQLFMNGVGLQTISFGASEAAGRLGVGAHRNPTTSFMSGDVDELAIWSRPLSAAEMAQLYNEGQGLAYPY